MEKSLRAIPFLVDFVGTVNAFRGFFQNVADYEFYPSPLTTRFTIELPAATPASGLIQDPSGGSLNAIRFEADNPKMATEYNFGDQAPGLYLIRIFQGNRIINHKIIKR